MTVKQSILKSIYPLFRRLSEALNPDAGVRSNENEVSPHTSFYLLGANLINGNAFDFTQLEGKKVLLVNVASDCGYTPQYTTLEKLYQLYREKLVVLGFPSNDFKGQEPGSGEEIERFCQVNFGVSFPLFEKRSVLNPGSHQVFEWLCQEKQNGWNQIRPSWNFCKYLVDEKGNLQAIFQPHISPMSKAVISKINS